MSDQADFAPFDTAYAVKQFVIKNEIPESDAPFGTVLLRHVAEIKNLLERERESHFEPLEDFQSRLI
jgi:hypothetical protein